MNGRRKLSMMAAGLALILFFSLAESITVSASEEKGGHDFLSVGVAEILTPAAQSVEEKTQQEPQELGLDEKFEAEKERMEQELTMANVDNALNIRAQADEDSEKVGVLYKDCGGTIRERKDGWTRMKSGDLI